MDRVRKLTGAEPLLTKGFTGKGITAAILDSGIYPHPDLKERIIDFHPFLWNAFFISICRERVLSSKVLSCKHGRLCELCHLVF